MSSTVGAMPPSPSAASGLVSSVRSAEAYSRRTAPRPLPARWPLAASEVDSSPSRRRCLLEEEKLPSHAVKLQRRGLITGRLTGRS